MTAPAVFVSDAIHAERQVFDPPGAPGPRGWHALSALYQASLTACGHRVVPVVRPETYQSAHAHAALGVRPGDWHLAVKPIEHLRPLHGIPNVFVCDWPFPELSDTPLGGVPFFDQVRMLGMADAVLCCTPGTADTLRRAGLDRVVVLPPHIPAPVLPASEAPAPGRFVCMADAAHITRQLGSAIEGFRLASAHRDHLHLTVCIQGGEAAVAALRARIAPGPDIAVAAAAPGWLAGAGFLLCADAAPGLCVPLVQAMLAGVPAVTTRQAGIDAISIDAIPIAAHPATWSGDDQPIGRWMPLTCHPPTAEAVRDAVLAAASLDQAVRSRMASAAQAAAQRRFGLAAFQAGLERLAAFLA